MTTTYTTSWGEILTEVDITKAEGNATDYSVMEKGDPDSAMVIYGWDEVELFNLLAKQDFKNPVWVRATKEVKS